MTLPNDPRHLRRINTIQLLFARSFREKNIKKGNLIYNIVKHLAKIDPMIEIAAPQFPLNKIAKIDVAILRLAIFELLFEKKHPVKVIINEAVELAKEFGGDSSPAFVNGVMGTILKKY